jgi:hypothetical protein
MVCCLQLDESILMQTSSFYQYHGLFRSPSLSPHSLHVYDDVLAEAYANASSNSSSIFPSPHRYYNTRVCVYFELSACESDNIEVCIHDSIFDI